MARLRGVPTARGRRRMGLCRSGPGQFLAAGQAPGPTGHRAGASA